MIRPAIKRIIVVASGFCAALLVGFVTLFAVGAQWVHEVNSHTLSHYFDADPSLDDSLGIFVFILTVAPFLTLVPAVFAVVIGELARIRSLLYYVVAGGAAAVVMPLIVAAPDGQGGAYSAPYFSIIATAGFAAGLVYWLIAGRRA